MFTVDLKELAAALQFIHRTVGVTPSRRGRMNPETRALRLDLGHQASLLWFDYETAIRVNLASLQGDPTNIVVDFDTLQTAVKTAGAKGVATFTPVDGHRLRAEVGGSWLSVGLYSGAELPALPTGTESARRTLARTSGAALWAAATTAAVAVGTEATLPMLTGLRFEPEGDGGCAIAATDRFRLIVAELESGSLACEADPALIPARQLVEFAKRTKAEDAVQVDVTPGGWVEMRSNVVSVTTRLLDCQFPQFRQLLPSRGGEQVTFTLDPRHWVERIKLLEKSCLTVHLKFTRDSATKVTADGANLGSLSGAACTLDVDDMQVDDDMTVAVSSTYLREILAAAPRGAKVAARIYKPSKPVLFEWDGVTALLMPVRIPENETNEQRAAA